MKRKKGNEVDNTGFDSLEWSEINTVGQEVPKGLLKAFRNSDYLAQVYQESEGWLRISVNRTHKGFGEERFLAGISWEKLQAIKDSLGYANCMAVEIFPEKKNIINAANMRHLWVLPQGRALPVGWISKVPNCLIEANQSPAH
jgi:hypothetical protein